MGRGEGIAALIGCGRQLPVPPWPRELTASSATSRILSLKGLPADRTPTGQPDPAFKVLAGPRSSSPNERNARIVGRHEDDRTGRRFLWPVILGNQTEHLGDLREHELCLELSEGSSDAAAN